MRDQRASSAVRHKQGLRPCAFERLVEPRYPLGTVRRFPVILDNTFYGLIPGFPAALPMAGIGVIKARKNERARHAAAPGTADTPNVPPTIPKSFAPPEGRNRRLWPPANCCAPPDWPSASFFMPCSTQCRRKR